MVFVTLDTQFFLSYLADRKLNDYKSVDLTATSREGSKDQYLAL